MRRRDRLAIPVALLSVLLVAPAQSAVAQAPDADRLRPIVGAAPPPAPVPPAVIARSAEGGVTVRAVRLVDPLDIDGRLDDSIYGTTPSISDFIQFDPREGEPATEKTEAWIFFDSRNIYISARCWDSHPENMIANEMRRDGLNSIQNENFSVVLDTFHDKRNGFNFQVNPIGGIVDGAVTDERNLNRDWNPIWEVRTGVFDDGWTVEMVIPFKSIRYTPGPDQVWGINLRRIVRWKNEWSFLTRVPAFLGARAMFTVSLGADLVGLEVPASGRNLELKPYVISGLRTDTVARPAISNKLRSDAGFDVKYGLTKSLTADFTYNTDFAQVEDDQQQVNLTRFSLFFPEKRDFFLEGQGIFGFGGVGAGDSGVANNTPVMFFSRAIGLNNGRPVPITAGGRVTGKAGPYAIGLLNIQTAADVASASPATNFTVLRVKRDFLTRSNVGAIYTRRSIATRGGGASDTFGVDGLYSASPSLHINTYLARTRTPGLEGDDTSYSGRLDYNTDRSGAQVEHLLVGRNFNPEVGFLRRTDFRRSFASLRFSPRPTPPRMKAVRKFNYIGSFDYFAHGTGRVDMREAQATVDIEFQNSDRFGINYAHTYEFIPQPFTIAPAVVVPVGGYNYQAIQTSYNLGAQRRVSGEVSYERGTLYDGDKHVLGFTRARIEVSPQFSVEPGVSLNWVDLPWGDFTAAVVSTRWTFTATTRMFFSALIQYNSSAATLGSNLRLRWEYRPGSEIFLLYNDGRDTLSRAFPDLQNRVVVLKVTRLLRF